MIINMKKFLQKEDRIIREKERSEITGIPTTTWWRYDRKGDVPSSIHLVGKTRGWLLSDIVQWLKSKELENHK